MTGHEAKDLIEELTAEIVATSAQNKRLRFQNKNLMRSNATAWKAFNDRIFRLADLGRKNKDLAETINRLADEIDEYKAKLRARPKQP